MALNLLDFKFGAITCSMITMSGWTRTMMLAKEWDAHPLIVDDEELILDLLKRQLKDEGYNILTASSGESALQLVKTHKVGVIVSDLVMPGMDGLSFLSKVRQIDDGVVTDCTIELDADVGF